MNARPGTEKPGPTPKENRRGFSRAQTFKKHEQNDETSVWPASLEGAARVRLTPCEPIEMRLLDVRIPWEPSSFVEDSDRKNIYFELRDPSVRAYLQHQEDALSAEGWEEVNSCLVK